MDNISEMQYSNLRKNYNSICDDILGENYYTMAMDVYVADDEISNDIKRKFKNQNDTIRYLKSLLFISCVVNFIQIVLYIVMK